MTCREKLIIEHPELVDDTCWGGCRSCPFDGEYKYLPREKCLCYKIGLSPSNTLCTKCWDQEVEEPTTTTAAKTVETETYDYLAYAKHIRKKYEALIEAGFNEGQAMQLIPMWLDD